MKTMLWVMCSLVSGALTFTSCVDDEKNLSNNGKTASIEVPSDFDWMTTRNVNLSLQSSPVKTRVAIYSSEKCNESALIAEVPVTPEKSTDFTINVPAANTSIFIQYPTEKGNSIYEVPISGANTRAGGDIYTIQLTNLQGIYENISGNDENGLLIITTTGTIAFEDNWPVMGDYDFNDLVADYKIETHYSLGSQDGEQYKHERIDVSVTFRAIGGHQPDKLGLQFKGIDTNGSTSLRQKHVARYEGLETTVNGVTVKLANPDQPEETPIFIFEGLSNLKHGNIYWNTENVDSKELPTLSFSMYFNLKNNLKGSSAVTQSALAANQDFFLITQDKREVHLKGYEPSKLFTAYDNSFGVNGTTKPGNTYYCSDKNFVWGIKLPRNFAYPTEKTDILEAYSGFKGWVESNGKENTNWYTSPNSGKVIKNN